MTSEESTALYSGLVLVIGAVGAALVKIIRALGKIHILVNSRLTKALEMIAALSQEKADTSGLHRDQAAADAAKIEATGGNS